MGVFDGLPDEILVRILIHPLLSSLRNQTILASTSRRFRNLVIHRGNALYSPACISDSTLRLTCWPDTDNTDDLSLTEDALIAYCSSHGPFLESVDLTDRDDIVTAESLKSILRSCPGLVVSANGQFGES